MGSVKGQCSWGMGWLGSQGLCWLTIFVDEQGVCGFRVGESDTAFLLCEFHQLMRGDFGKGQEIRRVVQYLE